MTDRGERVREGGLWFEVPRGCCDPPALAGREPRGKEGDNREQRQQAGGRARDGPVGPLPLRLDAEMSARLLEGHLDLPALYEPFDDLGRVLCEIGAEQRLGQEAMLGVADQNPSDRHRRKAGMVPTAVCVVSSIVRSPVPYQLGTISLCHAVVFAVRILARVESRAPFLRGRPIVPGDLGGAGS